MNTNTPADSLRVAIYARQSVSVEDGIDQQLEACRKLAEFRGWTVVDEYADNNTSASSERGAGTQWARMLADFDDGRFDAVVSVAIDRLLRRVVDVVELRKPNRPKDVRIITERDNMDTGSATGKVVLTLLVALAEAEIETKKARVLPYRDARHALGVPTPGRTPYGYRWIPKLERTTNGLGERRYDIVPDEAKVVRYIFRKAMSMVPNDKGIVLGEIAAALNDGTATDEAGSLLGTKSRKTASGALWRSTSIRRVLLSPYYAALLPKISSVEKRPKTVNGKPQSWRAEDIDLESCIPGDWLPIVSKDVVRVVRAALISTARRTNGGTTARKWLLPGIARCGAVLGTVDGISNVCGASVESGWTREGYRGYKCPRGHFHRRAEAIDAWAVRTVLERLAQPDAASLLTPAPDVDVAGLQEREMAIEARRRELLSLVARGTYSADAVAEFLDPLEVELGGIQRELARAFESDPLAEVLDADDVHAYWEGLSLGRQRAVLEALFTPILFPVGKGKRVTADNIDGTVYVAWRRVAMTSDGARSELNETSRRVLETPA